MGVKTSLVRVIYFVTFLSFPCVGCTVRNASTQPTRVKAQEAVGTRPVGATTTPFVALETATSVLQVIQPALTPTSTAVTVTPQPTVTLTASEKTSVLTQLMEFDGDCSLPCWWGIIPGVSNFEATLLQLANLGFQVRSSSAGMEGRDDFLVYLEFESEGDIVSSIRVLGDYLTGTEKDAVRRDAFARGWQNYSVKEMLNSYGLPSQAFIYRPFRADPGGGPSYHLLFFYENLGIVAQYWGDAEQLDGARYRACLDLTDMERIELFLYDPNQVDSVIEKILPPSAVSYLGEPDRVYDLISWEQVTDIDLESLRTSPASGSEPMCVDFAN